MIEQAFTKGDNKIMMYIPTNFSGNFGLDYKAEANKTIRQRLLDGNPSLAGIKVSHELAAGEVVLVALESETVELSRASDIQIVPHIREKGILTAQKFTTFAIIVPVFKPDSQNNLALLTATSP